jgi:hypothetical protein
MLFKTTHQQDAKTLKGEGEFHLIALRDDSEARIAWRRARVESLDAREGHGYTCPSY